jgi:hypothetical protein
MSKTPEGTPRGASVETSSGPDRLALELGQEGFRCTDCGETICVSVRANSETQRMIFAQQADREGLALYASEALSNVKSSSLAPS